MAYPPRRPQGNLEKAEAAFKALTTKVEDAPQKVAKVAVPGVKETVSIKLDRDVLDHFQDDGPGWQDRINTALRAAAGLDD